MTNAGGMWVYRERPQQLLHCIALVEHSENTQKHEHQATSKQEAAGMPDTGREMCWLFYNMWEEGYLQCEERFDSNMWGLEHDN